MKKVLGLLLVLLLLLSGCKTSEKKPINTQIPHDIPLSTEDYDYVISQSEDKLYLGKKDDESLHIYSYNLLALEKKLIGKIEDFSRRSSDVRIEGNRQYFYIGTKTNQKNENHLFYIDTERDEIEYVRTDEQYQRSVLMTLFNGSLFTIRSDELGKYIDITYIEQYDLKTAQTKKLIETKSNREEKEGTIILKVSSNKNNLFVYYERFGYSESYRYIDVYDKDLKLVNTVEIVIDDEKFVNSIGEFLANEDYLILRNYSGRNSYMSTENIGDITLLPDYESISIALSYDDGSEFLYYTKGSRNIFRQNENGELIRLKEFEIDNDYVLSSITKHGDRVVMFLRHQFKRKETKVESYKMSELV